MPWFTGRPMKLRVQAWICHRPGVGEEVEPRRLAVAGFWRGECRRLIQAIRSSPAHLRKFEIRAAQVDA